MINNLFRDPDKAWEERADYINYILEEEEFIDEDIDDEVMVYIDSMIDFCKEDEV